MAPDDIGNPAEADAPGSAIAGVSATPVDYPGSAKKPGTSAVEPITAAERTGLLAELVRTRQSQRRPLTPTEIRVARMDISEDGGIRPRAWKRLDARLSRPAGRSTFPTPTVDLSEMNFEAAASDSDAMDAAVGTKATPKIARVAVGEADPEGTAVGDLPLLRQRVERLRPMTAGCVTTTSLPVRSEVLRGRPPRRWGRPLDPKSMNAEDRQSLRDLLQKEVDCGAIERVTSAEMVELITPIYVVRSGGKLRLIHDCRPLNEDLSHISVRYSSVADVGKLKGKVATRIDVSNAFKHVGLRDDDRKLLCFQVGDTIWRWKTLNFGCSASPALFEHAMGPAVAALKAKGIRFVVYVDDLLVVADDAEDLDRAVVEVIDTLEAFGWCIAKQKVLCAAHTHLVFLGLLVGVATGDLRIPVSKAEKLGRLCREAVATASERVTLPALQSITGLLNFLSTAVPVIGAMTRGLYGALAEAQRSPGRHVWRRGWLAEELAWWASRSATLPMWEGRLSATGKRTVTLVTDASADGVGGIAWRGSCCPDLDLWVQTTKKLKMATQADAEKERSVVTPALFRESAGSIPDPTAPSGAVSARADQSSPSVAPPLQAQWPWLMVGELSAADKSESSAFRELQALRQAISNLERDGWLSEPTSIVWFSDSTAATQALTRWRSGSAGLAGLLTDLWDTVMRLRLDVRPHWISRSTGWLPGADWLSRVCAQRKQAEWSLPAASVDRVVNELGAPAPLLDAFATAANARTARFRSRWPEAGSEGQAFGDAWPVSTWAFPPFSLVGTAVRFWLDGPRHPLVLVAPVDDDTAANLRPAATAGAVRKTTAPWREPLLDVNGTPADGNGPWLRAFLLQVRHPRPEAQHLGGVTGVIPHAQPAGRPGPLK